jgi:hypothetical protein
MLINHIAFLYNTFTCISSPTCATTIPMHFFTLLLAQRIKNKGVIIFFSINYRSFTTKITTIGRVSTVPITVDTRPIRHVYLNTRV